MPDLARKLIRKIFWIIFTPPRFFFGKKHEKGLEIPDLARKLVGKIFWKFYPPPIIFFLKKKKGVGIAWFGEKIDQNFCLKILPHPPDFLGMLNFILHNARALKLIWLNIYLAFVIGISAQPTLVLAIYTNSQFQ